MREVLCDFDVFGLWLAHRYLFDSLHEACGFSRVQVISLENIRVSCFRTPVSLLQSVLMLFRFVQQQAISTFMIKMNLLKVVSY